MQPACRLHIETYNIQRGLELPDTATNGRKGVPHPPAWRRAGSLHRWMNAGVGAALLRLKRHLWVAVGQASDHQIIEGRGVPEGEKAAHGDRSAARAAAAAGTGRKGSCAVSPSIPPPLATTQGSHGGAVAQPARRPAARAGRGHQSHRDQHHHRGGHASGYVSSPGGGLRLLRRVSRHAAALSQPLPMPPL